MRPALFLAAFCALSPMLAHAGEGAFGLPKPDDPQRPGTVVLHGGGRITNDLFDFFVAQAGGEQAHIVLVPCAGFRVGDYDDEEEFLAAVTRRHGSWVSLERNGHVASFQFLFTDSPDDANDEDFVEPLKKATGVWFGGGAQERLNYRFVEFPRPTLFQRELKKVLERGGVVGGTSAGTAAMPEVMTIREYRNNGDPCEAISPTAWGCATG